MCDGVTKGDNKKLSAQSTVFKGMMKIRNMW